MVPAPHAVAVSAALAVLLAHATAGAGGGSRGRSGGAASGATSASAAASKASSKIGRRSRIGRGASKLGTVAGSRSSGAAASGGGERRRIYGSDFVDSDQPLAIDPSRGQPLGLGSQAVADDEPVASRGHASRGKSSGAHPSGARPSGRVGSASGRRSGSRAPRFKTLVPRIEGRLPRLSTQQPGLLVVLSDLSGSMEKPFAGQRGIRKVDALADVVNGVLLQFVDRLNQGGTIKNRLDVLLAGYDTSAYSIFEGDLAGRDIVSIAEVADHPSGEIEEDDGEGNLVPRPTWVAPRTYDRTAMRGAFHHVRGVMAGWRRRPAGPHLVLGVHVTDGESTDGSPADQLEALAAEVKA
ncbi:MAG TPA: hypothetical protein VFU21_28030, partial [Kofleriaceae bacterium]|nr:hypothetical protein [Kofleriaceae bacterium]